MSFVHNIRKQPHEKKIRLIWISCAVAAVILIILWAVTWHYHKDVSRDTSLFDTLGRGVHDFKNNYNKPIK